MPPATGLHFYRKRQTIDHLALERPQSLQIFRECICNALVSLERRIELLQQSYYGHDKNIELEIKRWLPTLNTVLRQSRVSYCMSKSALKDTFAMYERAKGDPTLVVDFDKDAIKTVIECIERVVQYLKTGFGDIITDMRAVSNYMCKYCRSFSEAEGDAYLDTAINYERQRNEFAQAIQFNIDDITDMAEKFETTGLRLADLGFIARDLAEKYECMHAPFLVIIPQAFENVKNAINGIRKWVEADEGYADFIHYDIVDLEQKKEIQEKKCREIQTKCSNCDHKIKTLKRELADCTEDINRFQNREKSLKKEKQALIEENKDVLFDLDIKQFRKEELKPNLEEFTNSELEAYKQLEREIAILSEKRPMIDKKLEDINKKLKLIQERKEAKVRKEKQISEARTETRSTKKEWRKTEVELERINACLSRLREIHRYKTTPEILKKIFHNMPLTARHVVNKGKKPISDTLERVSKITAENIENDWAKLYLKLPFHPARGEQTVAADIDEIGKQYMRHNTEEMCRQSLWRWRRMHTRASVDDLKKALLSIRRKDIVDLIVEHIARKASKPTIPSPAFRTVRFPKLSLLSS